MSEEYFDVRARRLSAEALQQEAAHGCYDPGEGGCMPNCKSCAARQELDRRRQVIKMSIVAVLEALHKEYGTELVAEVLTDLLRHPEKATKP